MTDKIAAFFAAGCKNTKDRKIGLELEHILVHKDTGKSVTYYEEHGQEYILNAFNSLCLNRDKSSVMCSITENGRLLGLYNNEYSITLEPGGQFEISIAPFESIQRIQMIYDDFRDKLNAVLNSIDVEALTIGYPPVTLAADIPLIPKKRYEYMNEYFKTSGTRGINMMRGSASTQISVDYCSEDDFVRKYRCLAIISPALKLLSANTPYFEGSRTDMFLTRTYIWRDVDNKRCSYPANLFDDDFGFKSYARYLMDTELIFVPDSEGGHSVGKNTAREVYETDTLSDSDISHIISMVFPDIRLKGFIELRVADSMPIDRALEYAALVRAIIYSNEAVDEILTDWKASRISIADIARAEDSLSQYGYDGYIYNVNAKEYLNRLILLANRAEPENGFLPVMLTV